MGTAMPPPCGDVGDGTSVGTGISVGEEGTALATLALDAPGLAGTGTVLNSS